MNAAFLFNADHFYGHGNYAIAANTIVFRTGVIQKIAAAHEDGARRREHIRSREDDGGTHRPL